MKLLRSKLTAGDDRWFTISAALLSIMGVPRTPAADLRAGKDLNGGDFFSGSLITALLQTIGPSQTAKDGLIHHLLLNADIASWGVGVTVSEFAREPSLVRELRSMLKGRSPGALSVAYSILRAGQRDVLEDAAALSFYYLSVQGAPPPEFPAACRVIRDFGSDEQFNRLIGEIRRTQYQDQHRYDELWRSVILVYQDRERTVLKILLKDNRAYLPHLRYSDIARSELTRLRRRGLVVPSRLLAPSVDRGNKVGLSEKCPQTTFWEIPPVKSPSRPLDETARAVEDINHTTWSRVYCYCRLCACGLRDWVMSCRRRRGGRRAVPPGANRSG